MIVGEYEQRAAYKRYNVVRQNIIFLVIILSNQIIGNSHLKVDEIKKTAE